jgi:virulence-associated protein VagC
MKRARTGKNKSAMPKAAARSNKRASVFRNGANQAVRLPQELRFPTDIKEVRICKQGDGLCISPVKPNWSVVLRTAPSRVRRYKRTVGAVIEHQWNSLDLSMS